MSVGKLLDRCAIMTIDPGGKTGVAMGWFNLEMESISACMRRAKKKESIKAFEIAGPPTSQAIMLCAMYEEFVFKSNVEYRLPLDSIYVIIEEFALRQKLADLAPVQVTAAFEVLLLGKFDEKKQITQKSKKTDHAIKCRTIIEPACPVIPSKQMPAHAMTYATNERLRNWGAWIVGSEHARDAMRHMCLKLNSLLS